MVSGLSFASTVYLARNLSQDEFGIFAIGISILLFITNVQTSLITSPMLVMGASIPAEEKQEYFTSLAIVQIMAGMIISTGLFLAGIIFYNNRIGVLLMVLSLIQGFITGQEFIRKVLLTVLEGAKTILNDFISYGVQLAAIAVLYSMEELSWQTGFYAYGITSALAIIVGMYQIRSLWNLKTLSLNKVMQKNWQFGKWLLASSLTYYVSVQSYLFTPSFFGGPSSTAILRAVQNIFGPTNILLSGFSNFIPQLASKRYTFEGVTSLKIFLRKTMAIVFVLVSTYCLILSIDPKFFLVLFYRGKYDAYANLLYLFGVYYVISSAATVISFGIRATQITQVLFRAQFAAAVLTCVVALPLAYYFGVYGAVTGMICSAITALVYTWVALNYYFKHNILGCYS